MAELNSYFMSEGEKINSRLKTYMSAQFTSANAENEIWLSMATYLEK